MEVISGAGGKFRVQCTSNEDIIHIVIVKGQNYVSEEQCMIEEKAVGDRYSATTSVISGGLNGDIYLCTASNGVTPYKSYGAELKGLIVFSCINYEYTLKFGL